MKAVACRRYGPPEVLELVEREKPEPREDEVLIRIHATSVTNSDLFIRGADIPLRFRVPMRLMLGLRKPGNGIIGEVLAGRIERVGPRIRRFRVGDRVFGLTGFSLGAYADYKCMKETDSTRGGLARMPDNLGFEEATAAAYGGLLALQSLEKADLRPGRRLLVYGASGTSGTFAVQYAKHLGAEVTGVCGAGNAAFVRSLGADATIDYAAAGAASELGSYDFAIDCAGKRKTSELKAALEAAMAGKGAFASIDDEALVLSSARLERVAALAEAGAIAPVNGARFPLERIVEAHRLVESGHKRGNVAITVNEG